MSSYDYTCNHIYDYSANHIFTCGSLKSDVWHHLDFSKYIFKQIFHFFSTIRLKQLDCATWLFKIMPCDKLRLPYNHLGLV